MDTRSISTEVVTDAIPEGVYIIFTSSLMMAQHLPITHNGNARPGQSAPMRLSQLIQYLHGAHHGGVGFILGTT